MTRNPIARVLTGILLFQIALALMLLWGDVQNGFRLPSFTPQAPALTEPVRPGDQTRRYRPDRAPSPGKPMPSTPLPNRLVLTALDEGGVLLEGAITAGDAERIAKQIAELSDKPDRLILNSPGGDVAEALTLGRYVRDQGFDTALRQSDICYSACPYVLAAGVAREIAAGGSVGVHQHYFGESTLLPAFVAVEDIQRGQGQVMTYLDEMGIDPLVMQHALITPPDEIYVLLPEELEKYRFIGAPG